jgi:Putative transposase
MDGRVTVWTRSIGERKHLRRKGLLEDSEPEPPESELAALSASAVSGASPPAGPEFRRGALPLAHAPLQFDKPLCAALDGFTLHAATRAGAQDAAGREALLKYILRPAVAQERVTQGPGGLVRIALKRPFADGTVAVDMDPLSLLCRLAASVPPPRFHTVRYAGVLGPASKLRPRIVPEPTRDEADAAADLAEPETPRKGFRYRPWVELLKRTFQIDICCPNCHGPMKLVAMVTDPKSVTRLLRSLGEPAEAPKRVPARGPPY